MTAKKRQQVEPVSAVDTGSAPATAEQAPQVEQTDPGQPEQIAAEPGPELVDLPPADRVDPATTEQATDYTRAGGHVLTDMGWMPEDLVERNGARRSTVSEES